MYEYPFAMQRDVAAFHDAFGHPNYIGDPQLIPEIRVDLRISLINEEGVLELEEAINKQDYVAIIDALIDTVYVSLGALVEMGQPINFTKPFVPSTKESFIEAATKTLDRNKELVDALATQLRLVDPSAAILSLRELVANSLQTMSRQGINPQPFFDEIQASNMSKLGADGNPVISRGIELDGAPEGKILKGPNYFAPDLKKVWDSLNANAINKG